MKELQILPNKAAKIILNRPLQSSATEALECQRFYHCCIHIYKCVNGLTQHSLDIVKKSQIHSYNTRNKDTLKLSKVRRNWGKQ